MASPQIQRKHLASLVALADHGNFQSAAASLYTTPATIAATVRQIERMVGEPLIERTKAGIRLNHRGAGLTAAAMDVLTAMDELVLGARASVQIGSGSLIALTTPTLAESVRADLVMRLIRNYPSMRVMVRAVKRAVLGDVALAVAAGEVDFGMSEMQNRVPAGVLSEPLGASDVAYAFPANARVRPRRTTLQHLEQYGLITIPQFENSSVYSDLRNRSAAVSSWVRARVAHRHAFDALALGGVAGFLCDIENRAELEAMGLHVAPFADPIRRVFATLVRADDDRPVIGAVLAETRSIAAQAADPAKPPV